jgi:cell fate regulator YaaT (PSP1 superfamily)
MMEEGQGQALANADDFFGKARPWGGKRRLVNVVDVAYDGAVGPEIHECGELHLTPGNIVVVAGPRGQVTARVTSYPRREVQVATEIVSIERVATPADLAAIEQCRQLEKEAMRRCLVHMHRMRIVMKLVQVHSTHDRTRLTFYFTSEDRVDFRTLVRALSSELRQRIEMRQIGVREGAGVVGGIGPCGGELCCSMFLRSFASVSIRFAKDQGMSLSPGKITGMCGRLKCCLVYEQPVYKELKRFMPKPKLGVITPMGTGNIVDVNILARKIQVNMHGGSYETFHMREVMVLDRRLSPEEMRTRQSREEQILQQRRARRGGSSAMLANDRGDRGNDKRSRRASDAAPDEKYMWADVEAPVIDGATSVEDQPAPKKKRRRRKKKSEGGAPSAGAADQIASGGESGQNVPDSGGERGESSAPGRRKRRRPTSGQGGDGAPSTAGPQAGASGGDSPRAAESGRSGGDGAQGEGGSDAPRRRRRRRRSGGGSGGDQGGSGGGGGSSDGGGGSGGGSNSGGAAS